MTDDNKILAAKLDAELAPLPLEKRLLLVGQRFSRPVFTTSLGLEDQAMTHAIAAAKSPISVVTLNTGRLFPETVELLEQTRRRYNLDIEELHPDPDAVHAYGKRYGLNGFYDTVEARHKCCHIRKVAPLQRALSRADGWITGLRREQSQNRNAVSLAEWSSDYGLVKLNLLADWSRTDLTALLERNNVPVNALHGRGYPSIGCEPCTRAVKAGEPERAGRWWWENEQSRECGLHGVSHQAGSPAGLAPSTGAASS